MVAFDDFILAECSLIKTRQRITIDRQLFGCARLGIASVEGFYDDQWDFPSIGAAMEALLAWDDKEEPTGWHRHPATGRYRINGDPCLEYVRSDGTVLDQVRHAFQVSHPGDILDIRDISLSVESGMPEGTRKFLILVLVYGGRSIAYAYYYPDHCVVLWLSDHSSTENIVKRLTEH